MEGAGERITFSAVARKAGVSTWLTYRPGIREYIDDARLRQQTALRPHTRSGGPTAATLRTDLEHARTTITALRAERDELRTALRHQLGRQLDEASRPDLTVRVDDLTARNQQLADQLKQATEHNTALEARVRALEEDLTAARTSLRRMIRTENRLR
ncbi:hypothetical protein BIV57_00265 [Mangrovactinospora gilvigrisea]|uniref:Transposase n=1 Tax=Mangrovactinospora gilvigrisea TaxID=1428644 RepID=A0A1J7CD63_9ACTN|nr:hypothetical protein BIV57_00265 [Mangrovactinospora gilvigrisea]